MAPGHGHVEKYEQTEKVGRMALQQKKLMGRGLFDFRVRDDKIVFFKWRDVKCVRLATVQRTRKDCTREEFACPQAIYDYNVFMGGVDKADMLCGLYGVSRKSKKVVA